MIGPSQTVLNAVAHALGRPPLDSEITLRPEAPHQSNRLYDVYAEGKHLIAKEYLRTDRTDAPRNEFAALRHVQSLLLAPQPVFFDPEVGPVVVYRYMEGAMWDRRVPSANELRALAELWLRFYALDTDGLWVTTGQAAPWSEVVASLRRPHETYARWASERSSPYAEAAHLCMEALDHSFAGASRLMRIDTPPYVSADQIPVSPTLSRGRTAGSGSLIGRTAACATLRARLPIC